MKSNNYALSLFLNVMLCFHDKRNKNELIDKILGTPLSEKQSLVATGLGLNYVKNSYQKKYDRIAYRAECSERSDFYN